MKPSRLYHFEDYEFLRIGKVLADRDAFIVFLTLTHAGPIDIGGLCAIFRREPSTLSEILEMLSAIGLIRRRGALYTATALGARAVEFLKETAERIDLPPTESTVTSSTQFTTSGAGQAAEFATNNSVMSDFRATSAVRLVGEDIGPLKANQVSNEPEGKVFAQVGPPEPTPKNAARPHNYL